MLLTHPGAELYGSDRMAIRSVTALVASGCRVSVVLPCEGPLVRVLERAGADVLVLKIPVLRAELLKPLATVRATFSILIGVMRAWALIRRQRPDVVYVNTLTQPSWFAAARLGRVPLVAHVHEAKPMIQPLLQRCLVLPLVLATRTIAVSDAIKEFIVANILFPRSRDIVVIHNGILLGEPSKEIGRNPATVLLVGRITPNKGQDLLVSAIALLRQRGTHVDAVIAGDSFAGYEWYKQSLQDLAQAQGVAAQVSFPGFVADPGHLYRSAAVCVVPSEFEAFGLVAVESMFSGCPTIVSADSGGLTEIVSNGVTGWTFEAGSVVSLAETIGLVLAQPRVAREVARRGQADVIARFHVDRFDQTLVGTVQEVWHVA